MSWKKISSEEPISAGSHYQTTSVLYRTSGDSPDNKVIWALENEVSYSEIEDDLRNELGIQVEVKNISAKKIDEDTFEQRIEFQCIKQHPAIPIVLVVIPIIKIVIIAISAYLIMDKFQHIADLDSFKIKTNGEISLFPIIVIGAIAVIGIGLIKR